MQNRWKSAFDSLLLKSGVFFQRQRWKEILIFLFFLLLSYIVWLIQTLQLEVEQRIELPIHYTNMPVEWVLSNHKPETIHVLLKDKGANLLYFNWNARFNAVDLNVSALPRLSDSTLHVSNRTLESELSKQIIASSSIISFEPREIVLLFDSLGSQVKPVSANVQLNPKPGFQLSDNITVSPPSVRLFGSSRALEALNKVNTKLITLNDVSKTMEVTAKLDLPAGIKAEEQTVQLTIPIEEFSEKKIRLPVVCTDIPEKYVVRMFPSSVEITCSLPLSLFRELTEEKLEITIPFSEFEANRATGKIPVRLTRKPAYVTNPILTPNELEFIIEHHE